MHYLDDYLTLAPPDSATCHRSLDIIKSVHLQLGVPLALEKVKGPSISLTFLGIVLDTVRMEARLPTDKLHRIRHQVKTWLTKRKATKRQILSLVGILKHATKVVRPGRTFLSRMYSAAAKLKKLSHHKKLSAAFRSDLRWWHTFVTHWNGVSFLHLTPSGSALDCCIETDASGSWGMVHGLLAVGSSISGLMTMLQLVSWQKNWYQSCSVVWCGAPPLSRQRIEFKCDTLALVEAINKGSSKDTRVMRLLGCLWFFTAYFDVSINASHLPGVLNTSADMLSRNQVQQFFQLHPDASHNPMSLPLSLQELISLCQLDWTSATLIKLFKETVCMFCSC